MYKSYNIIVQVCRAGTRGDGNMTARWFTGKVYIILYIGSALTRFVGEYGLANGTRPHPELGVLGRFRVTGQMFSQTALVHVMFAAHGTRVVGRPAFGHVRAGADVGVTCSDEKPVKRSSNTAQQWGRARASNFMRIMIHEVRSVVFETKNATKPRSGNERKKK